MSDAVFSATVRYIGAEVSGQSRSLPLIVELETEDGQLKPGLFAWVSVPAGPAQRCLCVASGAILRHEDQTFVFVEEQPGLYRRQDVEVGLETRQWTEIRSGIDSSGLDSSGIEKGQRIVEQGDFCLKSELLLAGEE